MARFFKPQQGSKRKHDNLCGQTLRLHITDLSSEGRGVARHGTRVVFLDGALPGEQVNARVSAEQKRYLNATTLEVIDASPERVAPVCRHFGKCGGCQLQHLEYAVQLRHKQAALERTLKQVGDLQIDCWAAPISDAPYSYRRRARISLKWSNKSGLQMGFRAAASDRIYPISDCPILTPALQRAFNQLQSLLPQLKGVRHLGHMELIEASEGAICLLRVTGKLAEADRAQLAELQCAQITVWLELNDGSIRDLKDSLAGDLHYPLAGAQLGFAAGDFIQVNAALNQMMVERALNWLAVSPEDRVLDLFCGVGNFSLPLAQRARRVLGVEGVPVMVERARRNAKAWQLDNLEFTHMDLSRKKALMGSGEFDKVLLDPARAGAAEIAEQLPDVGAQRLLYVSCNPATLARDAARICQQGYRVEKACLIDMFPQTRHAEAMLLFTRLSKAAKQTK